jgi:hypothetical protein
MISFLTILEDGCNVCEGMNCASGVKLYVVSLLSIGMGPAPTELPCGNCAAIDAATVVGLGPTDGAGTDCSCARVNCCDCCDWLKIGCCGCGCCCCCGVCTGDEKFWGEADCPSKGVHGEEVLRALHGESGLLHADSMHSEKCSGNSGNCSCVSSNRKRET